MANPTGSNYLQANLAYTWVDGDVYEIAQTDQQEGNAAGASFGTLGVDNQPHQILLNKIQYTHQKQIIDEENIIILQQFMALFTSSMGVNGYIMLGAQDLNLGQIQPIVQWGTINLTGAAGTRDALLQWKFTFNFPIAFPNAIYALFPYLRSNDSMTYGGSGPSLLVATEFWVPMAMTPLAKQGNSILLAPPYVVVAGSSYPQQNVVEPAQNPSDDGITGIGWLAIGY